MFPSRPAIFTIAVAMGVMMVAAVVLVTYAELGWKAFDAMQWDSWLHAHALKHYQRLLFDRRRSASHSRSCRRLDILRRVLLVAVNCDISGFAASTPRRYTKDVWHAAHFDAKLNKYSPWRASTRRTSCSRRLFPSCHYRALELFLSTGIILLRPVHVQGTCDEAVLVGVLLDLQGRVTKVE